MSEIRHQGKSAAEQTIALLSSGGRIFSSTIGGGMKDTIKQFAGLIGAGTAAACCLGLPAVLAVMGAAGLGFLIHDAYLFPLFVGFLVLSLWPLYRSARAHGDRRPFWLSLAGAVVGIVALWLMVTGLYPMPWLVYGSLVVLVAGSLWDLVNGRQAPACASETCQVPEKAPPQVNPGRRAVTGAALAASAAGVFYGMYKSVQIFTPEEGRNDIACWGINSCKGTTACSTAFNACSGQNECRGRGYLFVPEKECAARGGVPLQGSEADPARRS